MIKLFENKDKYFDITHQRDKRERLLSRLNNVRNMIYMLIAYIHRLP